MTSLFVFSLVCVANPGFARAVLTQDGTESLLSGSDGNDFLVSYNAFSWLQLGFGLFIAATGGEWSGKVLPFLLVPSAYIWGCLAGAA